MDLRRALLLFAIVLGLAAIASSIARPPEREADAPARKDGAASQPGSDGAPAPSSAAPQPGTGSAEPVTLELRAGARPQIRKLEQGRPATLLVEVETPSQVDIPSLGLTQAAERLTPARFDVLIGEPGNHRILLHPAASGGISSRIGTLKVVPAA
jgi:hypothetical protein